MKVGFLDLQRLLTTLLCIDMQRDVLDYPASNSSLLVLMGFLAQSAGWSCCIVITPR